MPNPLRTPKTAWLTPKPAWLILLATLVGGERCNADNSQDFADVKAVCTRCHTADAFLTTPRSWQRWNDVFHEMTERGATGTDAQLTGVTEYFLTNLTIINANTSPPDEIEWVLGASPTVRDAIVERRARHKFASLADLSTVPGIDQERLRRLKERILF